MKRAGTLAALDTPKVIAEARAALAGVREPRNGGKHIVTDQ
jgi:hypothetical protein